MSIRASLGALAALAAAIPMASSASDGGMGGGGLPSARGPSYDPNKEFHAGIAALGDGKYRIAKQDFEHVLAMVPEHAVALSMLGQAEAGLGDLKGAARTYEASLKSGPGQIIPARELAIIDERLGRRDRAAVELQNLKQRRAVCADSCSEAGDLDAAVQAVEAAMAPCGQSVDSAEKNPAR